MDPVISAIAANGASSALNFLSQRSQRNWEEEMANSAYQRAVKDMNKAGLNPALMWGHGAPSMTPSVAPPTFSSPFNANDVTTANRFKVVELGKLALEKQLTDAQSQKAIQEANHAAVDTELKRLQVPVAARQMERFSRELKLMDKDMVLKDWSARGLQADMPYKELRGRLSGDMLGGYEVFDPGGAFDNWLKSLWRSASGMFSSGKGTANGGPASAKELERRKDGVGSTFK